MMLEEIFAHGKAFPKEDEWETNREQAASST